MNSTILLMWMPSGMEWVIILVLVIMLFGLGKLPVVAKQLGGGIRDFQKSLRGDDEEEEDPSTPPKELEDQQSTKATASTKSEVTSS